MLHKLTGDRFASFKANLNDEGIKQLDGFLQTPLYKELTALGWEIDETCVLALALKLTQRIKGQGDNILRMSSIYDGLYEDDELPSRQAMGADYNDFNFSLVYITLENTDRIGPRGVTIAARVNPLQFAKAISNKEPNIVNMYVNHGPTRTPEYEVRIPILIKDLYSPELANFAKIMFPGGTGLGLYEDNVWHLPNGGWVTFCPAKSDWPE